MADLSVKYAGMTLKNPLICASGPPTDTVAGCKAAADAGFAAVTLKSGGSSPAAMLERQHAVPRFKVVDRLHPYERWHPRRGVENLDCVAGGEWGSVWGGGAEYAAFANKVKEAVGKDVKVGLSFQPILSMNDVEQYSRDVEKYFVGTKADYLELNYGHQSFIRNTDQIPHVIKIAKEKLGIPVILKQYPFMTFPSDFARTCQDAGVDGFVMFDSSFGIDFDINDMRIPFRNTWCYIPSGVILPWTNRMIAWARRSGITAGISASFGPWEWQDVIKCVMCGADTVQMCRKVMTRGYQEATTWLNEVNSWLDKNQYKRLADLKGKIIEKLTTKIASETPLELGGVPSLRSVVDEKKCHGCTDWCTRVCGYFAITAVNKKAVVDPNKCAACGMCEGVCPHLAISLQPRTAKA